MAGKRELKVVILGDDRTGGAFGSAGAGADGMIAKYGKLGAIAATAFAAAGVVGMSFEATLNQMSAVADVPQAALRGLSDLALKMGADTSFSAQQAADAMLELAKGGLTAAQIEGGALKETLTLAAAGGLDLGSAAGYMSNALNSFGLQAGDAGSVAAALAGGANASTASVESLGMALGQVGPGAVNAGLSLQETVAALAAFDNAGIKGSDAGTSLKTMLTRLVPSTEEAAGAMSELGLDFTNTDGSFVSLSNVAQQLQEKLGGLSEEQRSQALTTIFGSDAARAAAVMMNEGAAGLDGYIAKTSDLEAAQRVAASTTAGTAGAVEQMKGSFETLATTVGLKLNPYIRDAALGVTGFLNSVTASLPAIISIGGQVGAVVAPAFGFLSRVVGEVIERWRGLAQIVAVAAAVMSPVILILGLQLAALGVAATVSAVQSVAAWVAKQAAAVASGAVMLATSYRIVGQWIAMGAAATVGALRIVAGWVMTAAGALANVAVMAVQAALFVGHWVLMGAQALAQAARIAAAWLIAMGPVGLVIAAVVGLVAIVVANWDTIRAKTEQLWQAVKAVTAATWDWIRGAVSAAVGFLTGLFMNFTGPGLLIKHWDTIKGATGAAFDWVRGKVREGIDFIVGLFLNFTGPGLLIKHWDTIRNATSGVFEAVKNVVRGAVDAVTGFIGGLPGRAAGALGGLGGAITGVARGAWDAFAGAVRGGIDNAVRTVSSLPGRVAGAVGDLGGLLSGAGRSVIDGFIRGIQAGFRKVRDTLSKLTGMLPDWKGPGDTDKVILREAGQLVIGGFDDGLRSRFDQVKRTLGDLTDLAGMQAGGTAYVMGRLATDAPTGRGTATAAPATAPAPVEQHVHYHADLSGIVEPTLDENSVMQALQLVGMLYAPDATTP